MKRFFTANLAFSGPFSPGGSGGQRLASLAIVASIVTMVLGSAVRSPGQAQAPPTGKPKARPDDLLKSAPFDRITLLDNAVFEIDPVSPRPLPPVDKKKSRNQADPDKADESRARRVDPFVKKEVDESEQFVVIHLLEGEPSDFKVKRSSIKEIEYFEDMLLAEGDKQVKAGEFTRAFERYQLVHSRDPKWKGLDDRINKLLFEEGSAGLAEDTARGLRMLTDLHARKPDYPGLADRLASTYTRRIERSFEAGDFLVARRLLRELEQVAPGHTEAKAAKARFVARAKLLLDQAAKAPASERVDRLAEAARIWPDQEGLESAYREAFRAEPTLTVAVADLAEPVGPFPTSPASRRVARLLYLPILASDDEQATRGEASGQLLAGLETVELGKGLKINLKSGPTWSDGSRPVSAIDVARSLADRALPASPGYNARWANLLDRVEVLDENRVEIKLTRSSMKLETWLLEPVGPAHAAFDGWISSLGQSRRPVGDGPYRWESSADGVTLLHSVAEASDGSSPWIKRIREARFATPALSVEALLRGEIALLERVPLEALAELRKVPDQIKIGRFSTPSVHRIALDGRTPSLRNRALRRALSMAIDRRGLLEEVLLRHPPDGPNAVSDGPFVKGSFVDALGVEPLDYNPLLA